MKAAGLNGKVFSISEKWAIATFIIQCIDKLNIYEVLDRYSYDEILGYPFNESKIEDLLFTNYERIPTEYVKKIIRKFYDYVVATDMVSESFERRYTYYKNPNQTKPTQNNENHENHREQIEAVAHPTAEVN